MRFEDHVVVVLAGERRELFLVAGHGVGHRALVSADEPGFLFGERVRVLIGELILASAQSLRMRLVTLTQGGSEG